MNMEQNYKIKFDGLTKTTESTSAISKLSYGLETAYHQGLTKDEIKYQIKQAKNNDNFPPNLEYKETFNGTKTGLSTSVFVDKNTGKAIIGVAGTNINKDNILDSMQDINADKNIGLNVVNQYDSYFKETQKFIKRIQQEYDVETITGHSKGGRDATILGISNNIKNIVTYNSAPLSIPEINLLKRPLKYLVPPLNIMPKKSDFIISMFKFLQLLSLKNTLKNYNGTITNFRTNCDWLTTASFISHGLYFGKFITIHNGTSHSIDNFFDSKSQLKINKTLDSHTIQAVISNQIDTHQLVSEIKEESILLLNNYHGTNTATPEKLLNDVVAYILLMTLEDNIQQEFKSIKKVLEKKEQEFKENWSSGLEDAQHIGNLLNENEVLDALELGGATKQNSVDDMLEIVDKKKNKLNKILSSYQSYTDKIQNSIKTITNSDQELASALGFTP
ncbi:hypothetical protein NW127_00225 [Staphylococcus pettenkoferi]|nr:hypothetical protein [Staphylococcus pettenkoferi]MCY1575099.1 hypothetical protein [Staphylococcus pettenkoferi]MCY1618613.1 hypothetical protein [Staphylococcus pettenkoferi]